MQRLNDIRKIAIPEIKRDKKSGKAHYNSKISGIDTFQKAGK